MKAPNCNVLLLALMLIAPMLLLDLVVVPSSAPVNVEADPVQGPEPLDTQGRNSRAVLRNWDVVLAFEFDATKNQINDMEGALEKASQILYDSTDGQFRFRSATIWSHGKNFNDPDTQIKVLDVGPDYRANAIRGGIAIQGTNINLGETDFGMLWNTTFGSMTIAHEWAHFALYLPDEYDDVQMGQYIVSVPWCNNCLMSNSSSDLDSEFCTIDNHNETNPHAEAQSCWEQIKAHYSATSMPSLHANIIQDGPYYPASEHMTFNVHYPDLFINPSDISMTPSNPKEGDQVTLTAKVHNKDTILSGDVIEIRFYDGPIADGKMIATKSISLSGQEQDTISTTWIATGGYRNIFVTVDPNNSVTEWEDYSNNTANKTFHVLAKPKITWLGKSMDKTVPEDTMISLNLKPYESDVESADAKLQWTVTDYDTNFISSIQGERSANDIINISPVAEKTGTTKIGLTLTDGDGMSSSRFLNLTWTPINDAPRVTAINLTALTVFRTTPVQISFAGNDPESDPTTLSPVLELKPVASSTWTPIVPQYDGTEWKVSYTPANTAITGLYDIRAKLIDPENNQGEFFFLNATLDVLNSPPLITDMTQASNVAIRGKELNITIEGSDAEDESEDLTIDLEYKPSSSSIWLNGGTSTYKTGHYKSGKWTIHFVPPATAKIGNCDLRLRLNDSVGPGLWNYINKTIVVKNSQPTVTELKADSLDVLRTRTLNITVKGEDFESSQDKLVLTLEYSVGNKNDWTTMPSSQTKITYDANSKSWAIVYTPRKDVEVGTYYIRALLTDGDNEKGPYTELTDNLEVKNNPPIIKYTAKSSTSTGVVTVFDASASTDIEDPMTSLKFEWDFKDGGKSTKSRVSHVFNKPGKYEVTLKVIDKNGGTSTTKIPVTVAQGSVVGPGGGLGMALIGAIVAVVIVVVLIVVLLVMRKKGLGPFKK